MVLREETREVLRRRLYDVVRSIPRGRVATYGRIAEWTGGCTARMAGRALSELPEGTDVPWHRVLNSQGRISLPLFGGGGAMQRLLLEEEGVRFDEGGRVNLKVLLWAGPVHSE